MTLSAEQGRNRVDYIVIPLTIPVGLIAIPVAGSTGRLVLHGFILYMETARAVAGLATDTKFRKFQGVGVKPGCVATVALVRHWGVVPILNFVRYPTFLNHIPLGRKGIIFTVDDARVDLLPFTAQDEFNLFLLEGNYWIATVEVTEDFGIGRAYG